MITAFAHQLPKDVDSSPERGKRALAIQPDAPLPPPSSACKSTYDYWKELIGQGAVHPLLAEKMQILPKEHPATAKLNEIVIPLIGRLFPERDLAADPIQAFWSDGDGMSYLSGSKPTTLLIGRKFLSDDPKLGLCNLSGLAAALCHELYHEAQSRKFGPGHKNSPLEEGLADVTSFQRIYDAGLRPDQLLEYFRKQAGSRSSGLFARLYQVVDVHPIDALRVRSSEMVLYDFRRTHEGFDTLRESDQDRALFSSLLTLAKEVEYRSPLEIRLAHQGYENLPIERQLGVLAGEISSAPGLSERIGELRKFVNELKFPPAGDRCSPELVEQISNLYEAIFTYVKQPPSFVNDEVGHREDERRSDHGSSLLSALHSQLFEKSGYPITIVRRLAGMQAALDSFLCAKSPEEAAAAAQALVAIDYGFMQESGLFRSRNLNGPRHIRDAISHLSWNLPSDSRVGDRVPWQEVYEFALESPVHREEIVRGLLSIGAYDHRLGALLSPTARLEFGDKHLGFCGSYPFFGFSKYSVRRMSIDATGKVLALATGYESPAWETSLHENPEASMIDTRFFEIADRSRISGKKSFTFDIDPSSFHRLYAVNLQNSQRYQEELVKHILAKFREKDADQGHLRRCVRSLYQYYLSYKSHDVLFFIKNGERAATESPLYRFMMEDPFGCFSTEWRINILAMNSCVGRNVLFTRLKGKKQILARQREGEQFHGPLREQLHALIPEVSPEGAKSWAELIRQLQLFNERAALEVPEFGHGYPKPAARLFAGLTECIRLGKEGVMPNPSELGTALEIIKKDCWLYSRYSGADDTIYALFRRSLGDPVGWPSDSSEALRAWNRLDTTKFWRGDEGFRELSRILEQVEQNQDTRQRFDELTYLFQNCLPPETEFQHRAIAVCATTIYELLGGKDDGTPRYQAAFETLCKPLLAETPKGAQLALVEKILTVVESQSQVTEFAKGIANEPDESSFQDSNLWGRLLNATDGISILSIAERKELLDFLMGTGSDESIDDFVAKSSSENLLYKIRRVLLQDLDCDRAIAPRASLLPADMAAPDAIALATKRQLYRDVLSRLHRNFWLTPNEGKILIAMQPLFPLHANLDDQEASFDYVVEKRLASSHDHRTLDATKVGLRSYLGTQTEGDRALLLTAIMVSSNPYDGDRVNRIGQVGARVLPAMGPLEAKIAQAIQGHPDMDPQVARDMATTKYLANPPSRIELFATRDLHTPRAVLSHIQHTGALRGSGSFYLALDVTLKDGRDAVLRLLRKNAKERATFGGLQLRKALVAPQLSTVFGTDDLQAARDVLAQAEGMWSEEIDPRLIDPSQRALERFCDSSKVMVAEKELRFLPRRIITLEGYGPVSMAECSLSTKILGPHYIELERSAHKSDVATAVCTRVLHAILNGESFPTDLMGGNAKVDGNTIGMFDPGGMYLHSDDNSDRPVIKDLIRILTSRGDPIAGIMDKNLREKHGGIHSPQGRMLSAVQKAMLALYDFISDVPQGDLSSIGRAALKGLSAERLRELEVPFTLRAALWLPNKIRIVA